MLRPLLRFSLLLLLASCAPRQALRLDHLSYAPLSFAAPKVSETALASGARVFLLPDHDVPLVRLYAAWRGGSVYDPADKGGLAQVAGLAWRTGGTRTRSPEAVDEALEDAGMELSLGLGREKGSASLSVLPADLDAGLAIFAELLLEPAFREDRVAWAKAQVSEGIRRERDDPEALAFRELRRALYQGHPRGVVATEDTVARVGPEDVRNLHERFLAGGVWVIGVVGDFDPSKLLPELERRFGTLPGGGQGFPVLPAPPRPQPRIVVVPKALPQSTIVWARLAPERLSPEFYPLEIADHLVGSGGFQCRLNREIRSNRGLAYSVGGFYDAYRELGVLGAYASTKSESTAEVLGLLRTLLADSARQGFCGDEVASAKTTIANRHVFRYQDPADLVREQMSLALDGLPGDLAESYLPALAALAPEAVSTAAQKWYRPEEGVTVIVGNVSAEAAGPSAVPVEVVDRP